VFDILRRIFGLIENSVAVDLGTSKTLIYVKGKGIVLREPSVVAYNEYSGEVVATGIEAKQMLGKTPEGIKAKRPMKDGVIADFELVQEMLYNFLEKVLSKNLFFRPKVLISVPSSITEVEARAVRDSAESAGAQGVMLVAEPIAGAVGIGLPIDKPVGNMIVDIGGGTTEIAVLSLSGIVSNASIRVAGDEMDEAIVNYIREKYRVDIGEQTAEQIKIEIGNVFPTREEVKMEIRGKDLIKGEPTTLEISSHEIRQALRGPVMQIVESVKKALEKTPPELVSDIIDRGIYLVGGGALLRGLDELIMEETNIPVIKVENPREAVVMGVGKILDNLEKYEHMLMKAEKHRAKKYRPE